MNTRVHLLSFQVAPSQSPAQDQSATGAIANAYVLAPSTGEATAVAQEEITAAGWRIETLESATTPDSSELDGDGAKYYEQCELDGFVLVLHTWRDEH